ncbi:MAG: glycosyltransferase family 4 protein [Bacteroidales bacterium]|nr:glycosyltransferase family 4 protein [Bacteroidales bacterium]
MNIAVNTRLLIKDKLDGIGWFTFESLKRITKKHPEHRFFFIFDRPFADEFIFSDNIEPLVVSPPARHPFLWYYWFEFQLPKIFKKIDANIFLSPDGYLSLSANIKSLPVIHDINFAHNPEDLPFLTRKYYNRFFPKFAQKAVRIATVSEYSKYDISKTYGIDKNLIDVVYNGANSIYQPLDKIERKQIKQIYTQDTEYFIFIGSIHPRKNVVRMLWAFDEFRKDYAKPYKLLIIGNYFFKNSELKSVHQKMRYRNDVLFMGHQTPEKIHRLLGAARALILVSKFEGFGIPVLEAMNCNVPAIVSDITSLPEVGGDAVLYADPFSVNAISKAMLQMADDEILRKKLIENAKLQRQKFSWDKTADKLWNSLMKIG